MAINDFNPIQDGLFPGCSRMGGCKKSNPLWNLSHISYNDQTWHSYTLPKVDPKNNMNHVTHSLISAEISIFSPEINKFCYIKKYRYRLYFDTSFLFILTFLESLSIVIINMVKILMMSTKIATPVLLKIKVFWNKGYYVIYSVYDVTN